MNGFYILVTAAILISILITFCLSIFFKNRSIIKYIPSIISVLACLGFYVKSRFFSSGFDDLGYLIFTLISGIVFFASLITALIMELVQRKSKRTN